MIGSGLRRRWPFQPSLYDAPAPASPAVDLNRHKHMHLYHHMGGVAKHERHESLKPWPIDQRGEDREYKRGSQC